MLPISYGSMLVETLVAVLALIAVASLARDGVLPKGTPPLIFATAVAGFLHQLGLPSQVSFSIVSLAVSSFVLTTRDTVARLGRLSFQELFPPPEAGKKAGAGPAGRILTSKAAAAFFTLVPACLLAITGYQNIWALFGAANQLLAALTLIACILFFKKSGKQVFMLYIPALIMLAVTFSSLVLTIKDKIELLYRGAFSSAAGLQLIIAALLFSLGILVVVSCAAKLRSRK
jgi:carbon starvation protein